MNVSTIIGRLVERPESRTAGTTTVTAMCIAVTDTHSRGERTDFIDVEAWGKLGEICQKYLDKGHECCVMGHLRTSIYDSNGIKKKSVILVAEDIDFLRKPRNENLN